MVKPVTDHPLTNASLDGDGQLSRRFSAGNARGSSPFPRSIFIVLFGLLIFRANLANAAVPVITSPSSANGNKGQFFSFQVTATNGPTLFSATNLLIVGLTINSNTGLISGTPPNGGVFNP